MTVTNEDILKELKMVRKTIYDPTPCATSRKTSARNGARKDVSKQMRKVMKEMDILGKTIFGPRPGGTGPYDPGLPEDIEPRMAMAALPALSAGFWVGVALSPLAAGALAWWIASEITDDGSDDDDGPKDQEEATDDD